jgi:hypothetical protein
MATLRFALQRWGDTVMDKLYLFVGGLVVGLGGMFFLDPARGRRRRALARARASEVSRAASKVTRRAVKGLSNGPGKVLANTGHVLRRQFAAVTH